MGTRLLHVVLPKAQSSDYKHAAEWIRIHKNSAKIILATIGANTSTWPYHTLFAFDVLNKGK